MAQKHKHTHTLSHSLTHTHTLSHTHIHTHSLTLTHTYICIYTKREGGGEGERELAEKKENSSKNLKYTFRSAIKYKKNVLFYMFDVNFTGIMPYPIKLLM